MTPAPTLRLLSVVVIGRNEGERLRRCLASVARMTRGAWDIEVIYVDSGSRDGSVALAQSMGARVIALTPERPTAALGRNAGWRAAHGELVLFLDGDTVLDESFAADSISAFADERVACVWGHRRELDAKGSLYNRVLDLDWVYAPGWTPFCGGDALFRREALERVGGYDETLIAGEEPEMCRRMIAAGYGILHADRAMTLHDLAITRFTQYWKRAERAGHAYAEVSQRFAASGAPFWSEEVRRNRERALMLCALPLGAALLCVGLRSLWPAVLAALLLAALVLRTAWKARWKSADPITLLLYAAHSHLQQLPIFAGQIRFHASRRKGRRLNLVEYKET